MSASTLRNGYTTGSCAAAASKAAALFLLSGFTSHSLEITVPRGGLVKVPINAVTSVGSGALASVTKDAGDDPDVTDGLELTAFVSLSPHEITLLGGKGIGKVTLPGLDRPVGDWAINTVPRHMITDALNQAAAQHNYTGGFTVTLSIPKGEETAAKTYNPRLGIIGGLSILGTTGIVEPMSSQAIVDTTALELKVHYTAGKRIALLTPGSYGEEFLSNTLHLPISHSVKCSNFIGEALDCAQQLGYERILLVGHLGKLVKLAGGIFNTHSKYADARMEILSAHAAMQGGDSTLISRIMSCVTTDEAVAQLKAAQLCQKTMASVAGAIEIQLAHRCDITADAILFSSVHGLLAMTKGAPHSLAMLTAANPVATTYPDRPHP